MGIKVKQIKEMIKTFTHPELISEIEFAKKNKNVSDLKLLNQELKRKKKQ